MCGFCFVPQSVSIFFALSLSFFSERNNRKPKLGNTELDLYFESKTHKKVHSKIALMFDFGLVLYESGRSIQIYLCAPFCIGILDSESLEGQNWKFSTPLLDFVDPPLTHNLDQEILV